MINLLLVFCEIKQENYSIIYFFLGLAHIFLYFLFGIILF